jgi:4-hydroxy-tetrahydrodipicolinate synthase
MTIGRHVSRLAGFAPAIPTPFDENNRVDAAALERFCARQVAAGATAPVVCGVAGEAPTLHPGEHREIIRIATGAARGIPVIAGAGSNATAHAIELTRIAESAGADAIVSVVPYYNKPTQAGITEHFRAIARSTGLPILLHDVPQRTARGLEDSTVAQLAEFENIIGLQDATGDIARVSRLRARVGQDFRLLSGDDATVLGFLVNGGDGCISVVSNVAPGLCRDLYLACRTGNMKKAQRLAGPFADLTQALSLEPDPVAVKYALSKGGFMRPAVRLPLVTACAETRASVDAQIDYLYDRHESFVCRGRKALVSAF